MSNLRRKKTNGAASEAGNGGGGEVERREVCEFSLNRGDRVDLEESFKELKYFLEIGDTEGIVSMIRETVAVRNFGGIMYSVRFRTDRPISLSSLGFWGPGNGKVGHFKVKLIISEYQTQYPTDDVNELVLSRVSADVAAPPGKIFQIPLRERVSVRAWKWIRIQFQLDGPDTFTCHRVLSSYLCKDSNVTFDFHSSSHQLPTITYTPL